jgi:hypothetical protein
MKTTCLGLAVAAFAVLGFAANSPAQSRPSGLLNSFEVQQLVSRAEPGDHVRLTAHFRALADRYAAEATQHTSMAHGFAGNPSRNFGSGMRAYCKRLADLNTQSATTVRELAAYHDKLSVGSPATPPAEGGRFAGGAGAPAPTERELKTLAVKARTPAEHGALQEYFLTLAKKYSTEAGEHAALAQTYRGTRLAQAAVHHDLLATLARDAAKEADESATIHKQLR